MKTGDISMQTADSEYFKAAHLKKKKVLIVNTNHCRSEEDTVQYVIEKNGYRESTIPGEGHVLWYGLALRDHDIDHIKMKNSLINRYPLMDVS